MPSKNKSSDFKPVMETDGDFYSEETEGVHTFKLFPPNGCVERGIYFPYTKCGYTHLARHEVIADIISTTIHENIHQAIDQITDWEEEEDDIVTKLDDVTEHIIIRRILWADEYLGITDKELN